MTPFEEQIVRALGSIADLFRQESAARTAFEQRISQKLDAAISYRDEAMSEDLAATNRRLSEAEKQLRELRANGHT